MKKRKAIFGSGVGLLSIHLSILLFIVGCASTDEYRVNAFSPKKGPSCPGDQYAVCEMFMGKPLHCDCVDPIERDVYETE